MTSPSVRVNTFFKQKQKPFIDSLSKLYVAAASIIGLNRLGVILNETKCIVTSIAAVYSVLLCTGICYASYIFGTFNDIASVMALFEYLFVAIFSFITFKRMERYYNELNNFDAEMGCRPTITSQSINNLILMVIFNVFFTFSYWMTYEWGTKEAPFYYQGIAPNLLHCLELFFYGHLLSLLVARLRLINYFVETALSNGKTAKCPNIIEFSSFKTKSVKNTDMKKLMDLYYITIKAYDFLVEAIKWQVIKIISFASVFFF